jgi:hypothetical protein
MQNAEALGRIADALEHIADSLSSNDRWLSMVGEGAMNTSERLSHITSALSRIEALLEN